MTHEEKLKAAAEGFAERFCPYEMADCGANRFELLDETTELLRHEPKTVLDYWKE